MTKNQCFYSLLREQDDFDETLYILDKNKYSIEKANKIKATFSIFEKHNMVLIDIKEKMLVFFPFNNTLNNFIKKS